MIRRVLLLVVGGLVALGAVFTIWALIEDYREERVRF